MNKEYFRGLHLQLTANQMLAEEDLKNLLSNTVGIGEHVHIHEDVYKLVTKIDTLQSQKETINSLQTRWSLE